MGSTSSVLLDFNVWTEDEKAANNKCIEMQRRISEFSIKYFFYGVLVKIGKTSEDPQSPAWLEVDIDTMQQEVRKQNSSLLAQVDMKLLNTVPSGVSIDSKGRIKVIFNNTNLTYELIADDIDGAIAYASGKEYIPTPEPPVLEKASTNFITLKWQFKQPIGISQKVEIQFVTLFVSTLGLKGSEKSRVHKRSLHWQTYVIKSWELPNFSSHTIENLTPGIKLHFRIRVKNHLGWSEYSAPSELMITKPDRPDTPSVPVVQVATPTAVQLRWSRPKRSNGATVTGYVLRGKAVGDEFLELYKGPLTSFLVMDLHPEHAYLFDVAAINAIGTSDFSITVATTTPARMTERRTHVGDDDQDSNDDQEEEEGREEQMSPQMKAALESKEAWIECWDPRTERYFYFNRLVGKRQVDRPECMGPEVEDDGSGSSSSGSGESPNQMLDDEDGEVNYDPSVLKKHQEAEFRKKRFRLIRAIHLHNNNQQQQTQTNRSPVTAAAATVAGAARTPGRSSVTTIASGASSAANTPASAAAIPTTPVTPVTPVTNRTAAAPLSTPTSAASVAPTTPVTPSSSTGGIQGTGIGSTIIVQKEPFVIELRRKTMLADAYKILHNKANLQQLGRRLKITFKGEEGIDSGGLGKEAFLLISRESAFYGGPINKHWIRYLSDATATSASGTKDSSSSPSSSSDKTSAGFTATQTALLQGGYFFSEETTPAATQLVKTASTNIMTKNKLANTNNSNSNKKKMSRQGSLSKIIANMDVLGRLQGTHNNNNNNQATNNSNNNTGSKAKYAHTDGGTDDNANDKSSSSSPVKGGQQQSKPLLHRPSAPTAQQSSLQGSLMHIEDNSPEEEEAGRGQVQGQALNGGEDRDKNRGPGNGDDVGKVKVRQRQLMNITASIKLLDEDEHITRVKFAQFLGRFIGKAIYDRQLIDIPLASILYKHMVGDVVTDVTDANTSNAPTATAEDIDQFPDPVSEAARPRMTKRLLQCLGDMRSLDNALYRSLLWMLNNDITYIIDETFSVPSGEKTIALCKDGDKREVNEDNKFEYVELITRWKTTFSVASMLNPFLQSFYEIVPLKCLKDGDITAAELALMLNGKPDIDIEELRAYCVFQGGKRFNEQDEVVLWLWQALRDMEDDERRNFLKFFTGSSRIPLDGFDPPITVTEGVDMAVDSLPKAHTCFNQLVLPRYSSYHRMKDRLLFAMNNTEGFALS